MRWTKDDLEPLPGSERERQRWGSVPTIAREALAELNNPDRPPFPFESWAAANRFAYDARHAGFYCLCASAAEAYFVRPFLSRSGATSDGHTATCDGTAVRLQAPARIYRIDAVVTRAGFSLAIEIDGLAYHHRTRQQIAADYLRERRLVLMGHTVIRFTAPEVFRSPEECWRQIDAILAQRCNPAA